MVIFSFEIFFQLVDGKVAYIFNLSAFTDLLNAKTDILAIEQLMGNWTLIFVILHIQWL
jgi:hypothetical protein